MVVEALHGIGTATNPYGGFVGVPTSAQSSSEDLPEDAIVVVVLNARGRGFTVRVEPDYGFYADDDKYLPNDEFEYDEGELEDLNKEFIAAGMNSWES